MKVLVLGANGKTGSLVMNHAIAAGHKVSLLVRRASGPYPNGVRVIVGDALKPEDVY